MALAHYAWLRGRRAIPLLTASAICVVLLAGAYYAQNGVQFGGASGLASIEWVVMNPGWSTLTKNGALILSPLLLWLAPIGLLDPTVPYGSPTEWTLNNGLGPVWLVLAITAVAYVMAGAAVRRGTTETPALLLTGLGLVFLILTLLVMRHQPSVQRFVLPAVALLTPSISVFFHRAVEPRAAVRLPFMLTLFAVGSGLLAYHGQRIVRQHIVEDAGTWRLTSNDEAYGPSLEPFGRRLDGMKGGRGARLGAVTSQYSFERFLFGGRYQNSVVPLSYDVPRTLRDLGRLRLDAIWVDTRNGMHVQLFARDFARPAELPDRWRATRFTTYDEDFWRAHAHAVYDADMSSVFALLMRRDSGWRVWHWNDAGVLFEPGTLDGDAIHLFGITNPNGLETVDGQTFVWLGGDDTTIRLYATREGTARLTAEFIPGPSVSGAPVRRVRLIPPRGPAREISLGPGSGEISVELASGYNVLRIQPLDRATIPITGNGDQRPLVLGVKNLAVRW